MENKVKELMSVKGKEVSENHSPTLRAKLIKVGRNICTFEAVQSPYVKEAQSGVGKQYLVPTAFAWNAFFF